MSGGTIFRQALAILCEVDPEGTLGRDVLSAMEAATRPSPLPVLYEAAHEAGLGQDEICRRGAAIFFAFAAGNLADDLMDGECTYLSPASRVGPVVQYVLQSLASYALSQCHLRAEVAAHFAATLARSALGQLPEVYASRIDLETYRQLAERTGAMQWQAYLSLLWAGTALEAHADTVGRALAIAAFVHFDLRDEGPRLVNLDVANRVVVVKEALALLDDARRLELRCLALGCAAAEQGLRDWLEKHAGGGAPP